jgi:type II secretory pathway pseudopilin PulG
MVIIAIIMLIAVAAFTGISRAAAPRKAAENLETAISLARQYAVAKNRPVLFLLLDKDFNSRNSTVPNISLIGPTRGRHYAAFDAAINVYVIGWTELPQGVVFDDTVVSSSTSGRNVLLSPDDMFYNRTPPPGPAMIPFPGTSDTNCMVTLPGLAFKTDGTLRLRGTLSGSSVFPLRVNVAEGSVDSAGVVTVRAGGLKCAVKVSMLGHAVAEAN